MGVFIVEVVGCKGKSSNVVLVWNRSGHMGWVARICLLLLLVLQIALDEGANS